MDPSSLQSSMKSGEGLVSTTSGLNQISADVPGEGLVSATSGPIPVTDAHSLERQEMSRLLFLDPEFVDIVIAFSCSRSMDMN